MEANPLQKNSGDTSVVDHSLPQVGNQLQYPFDYTTQRALDEYFRSYQAYPVGSIYMNASNSQNPSQIFGYGVWVAIEGNVVAGFKSGDPTFGTIGATIGEATHTLTETEIPSHTHGVVMWGNAGGTTAIPGGLYSTAGSTQYATYTGGDGGHNNIQPTLVAYVWKRTA